MEMMPLLEELMKPDVILHPHIPERQVPRYLKRWQAIILKLNRNGRLMKKRRLKLQAEHLSEERALLQL
jgi:hypothetical protein